MSKRDLLLLIANATDTCADVTLRVAKDHIVITSCPPVVVQKIVEAVTYSYRVSIQDGGLRIDTAVRS